MKGIVDSGGRSLLTVTLQPIEQSAETQFDVWIDTGFTGDLVMPQSAIDTLGLPRSGSIDAILADGSQTELNTYSCVIERFGNERNLEVIANEGEYPLLGVGLLRGLELRVDYRNLRLTLEPAPKEST
jgi:clan AA aspartic protease